MGIGVAIVYFPLYIIMVITSFITFSIIRKSTQLNWRHLFFGYILGTITTLILIWTLKEIESESEWAAFFAQCAASIFMPLCTGIILAICSGVFSSQLKAIFKNLTAGALFSVVTIPGIALIAAENYYNIVNYYSFSKICRNAETKFLEDVPQAKIVMFEQDRIYYPNGNSRQIATLLLVQSLLNSVERPTGQESEFYKVSPIEEITINGEKILRSYNINDSRRNEFVYKGVQESSAEYIVNSQILEPPQLKKKGIGGARIEIRKAFDGKLIAYSQYYWDKKTSKSCILPKKTGGSISFLLTALNIIHPDGIKGYE